MCELRHLRSRWSRRERLLASALLASVLLTLTGCSAVEFYWQGVAGQLDLLSRAKPIAAVTESSTDPLLKARLERVQKIRAFASSELALPDNGSYRRYADLGRPFVVWNVFAAPELSLTPRQWCFPVAGCVNYRGYFAEDDARGEAARIAAQGDDVHVGGVPAYSTLGYFDDPVLSSFIGYREPDLARLLFHELAHQIVYVKDDTAFNESFAVAVEEEGLRRWLEAQQQRPDAAELAANAARGARLQGEFRNLIRHTRERLAALYASDLSVTDKRAGKAAAFADMSAEYAVLRTRAGGAPGYDRWIASGANNAGIAAIGLYTDRVPQFRALLAAEGGDLPRFYERVKALAALPKAERDAALAGAAPSP
jgi:predicted aminopeptidase